MDADIHHELTEQDHTTAYLTSFPSCISNDDSNTGLPSTKTSESNYAYVSITIQTQDQSTARKSPKIVPIEFEHWLQSNGRRKDLSLLINTKVTRRKRKSLLNNVSYTSFLNDNITTNGSSSSSSSEEENEVDYTSSTTDTLHNEIPQPLPMISSASSKSSLVKKSSLWLSGLFQKQMKPINSKKSKSGPTTITTTIFNFVSSNKNCNRQPPKELSPVPMPKSLPTRYPMPIERVIYQIAFIKIRNPNTPLQQQVVISNMIYWYTSEIRKEATERSFNDHCQCSS